MGKVADTNTSSAISANASVDTKRHAAGGASTEIGVVKFHLLRSAMYHDMRQTSLQRVHKMLLFLTVLLGSGAIAAFGAQFPVLGQAAGVAVAVISAAQMVWDFGGAAQDHADLRRRFFGLLADAEGGAPVADLNARCVALYADEPPMVQRINDRAHNTAGQSLFGDDFERV